MYIPSCLHIERNTELSSLCCAKCESDLLCVIEFQDGVGLAISGSQMRTELAQDHSTGDHTTCEGGMSWNPGVSDFKALHSPFVSMNSKSSLILVWHFIVLKQALILPRVASNSL